MSKRARFLKFQIIKKFNQLLNVPITRFYQDRDPDYKRSKLIAGVARSGTTWVADLLAGQQPARIMFEPFNSDLVRAYAGFNYYQYMRPETDQPDLFDYAASVVSGKIRNHWIDQQVDQLRPQVRIIKAVRANLMLGWLYRKFPQVDQVLVIRHPCAVYLSWKNLGWDIDKDLSRLLENQVELLEDYPSARESVNALNTPEEKFAWFWSMHHLVPLAQFEGPALFRVFYENLCEMPEQQLPKIFSHLNLDFDSGVFNQMETPSRTAVRFSAILTGRDRVNEWKNKLSVNAIDRILDVVEKMGLGQLYGDSTMPHNDS